MTSLICALFLLPAIICSIHSCSSGSKPFIVFENSAYNGEYWLVNAKGSWLSSVAVVKCPDQKPSFEEHIQFICDNILPNDHTLGSGEIGCTPTEHYVEALIQFSSEYDCLLTAIRDEFFELLVTSNIRPTAKRIERLLRRTQTEVICPYSITELGYKHKFGDLIFEFLIPKFSLFRTSDAYLVLPFEVCRAKAFGGDSVAKLVDEAAEASATYKNAFKYEQRIRNPYGLGEDIVIGIPFYYQQPSLNKDLIAKSFEVSDELSLLKLQSRIDTKTVLHGALALELDLFVNNSQTGELEFVTRVYTSQRFSGKVSFPNLLQLKRDIEEELRLINRLPLMLIVSNQLYDDPEPQPEFSFPKELLDLIAVIICRKTGKVSGLARSCKELANRSATWYNVGPSFRARQLSVLFCVPVTRLPSFIAAAAVTISLLSEDNELRSNSIWTLCTFLLNSYYHQLDDICRIVKSKINEYKEKADRTPVLDTYLHISKILLTFKKFGYNV